MRVIKSIKKIQLIVFFCFFVRRKKKRKKIQKIDHRGVVCCKFNFISVVKNVKICPGVRRPVSTHLIFLGFFTLVSVTVVRRGVRVGITAGVVGTVRIMA